MINFRITINGSNLDSNIILDSSFSSINNYNIDGSNNLLIYNDDYVDIVYNNNLLFPSTPNEPESEIERLDYIIVGGGPGGIMASYKINEFNPGKKIMLLEENSNTIEDYKNKGYDNTSNWQLAMNDASFQNAFQSNNSKTIWLGKGLGGGTLHFGLQYIDNINKNYEEWSINNYFTDLSNITNVKKYDYQQNIPSEGWNNIKTILENSSNEVGISVYNNKVYSTDLSNNSRLLLGNLINDNSNINIQYGKKIERIIFDGINVDYILDNCGNKYYTNNLILSAGAIKTPEILQRSGIDCGNKIFDHLGFNIVYGKLKRVETTTTTTTTQEFSGIPEFQLNTTNIGKINEYSGREVYYATGSGVNSTDLNKVYDFSNWTNQHPGGSSAILRADGRDWELKYPHSNSRWNSYKSNFIEIDGKKLNETINYNNLPSNLKSPSLYSNLFPDEEVTETITEVSYLLEDDLSLNQNNVVNHLQTRDNSLNWQTYYSGIPGSNNMLIVTHALSTELTGSGSVKLNSQTDQLDISLDYYGNREDEMLEYLLDAFNKNDAILKLNGYTRINPAQDQVVNITKEYIKQVADSIYHYHGTAAIGEVVDQNQKVIGYNNLYIADNSVLPNPWGGSSSVPAAITGIKCANNFKKNIYFISNDGLDGLTNDGSLYKPFKSLKFLKENKNIDNSIINFREGLYELNQDDIVNEDVEIKGYNNEKVIFDGTRDILTLAVSGEVWQPINKTIVNDSNINETVTLYRLQIESSYNLIQLFNNREEIINARYPSGQWKDESVYSLNNWCHGYYNKPSSSDPFYYENGEIIDFSHTNIDLLEFVNKQKIIDPSFTLKDAMINLNVGSFKSYTKIINSVEILNNPDRIKLKYHEVALWKTKHHYYYLENKLEFLNSENEWYYDIENNYIYVRLTNDIDPNLTNIRVKIEPYVLNLNNANNCIVENINFFGTTLKVNGSDNVDIKNCNFYYPSCYAHMMNQINPGEDIDASINQVFNAMTKITGSSNNCRFYRCAFKYTDGTALEIYGGNNILEDNYFSYIDKTVANLSSVMTTIRMNGNNNLLKNNRFYKTAASSTLNSGNEAIIEYNNLSHSGYLQSDGALIHCMVNQQPNVKIRFNWVHDTIKYGIRFDGDGEGYHGYIHHNIGWNCEGNIMVKGGELDDSGNSVGGHYIYNNTMFNSEGKNDIIVLNDQKGVPINYGSIVINNLSEKLSGHRSDIQDFEDRIIDISNLVVNKVEDYLVDVSSYDFRPINNAEIVNKGNITFTNSEFDPSGVDSLTKDIGAMEYNGIVWKAGITWNDTSLNDDNYVNSFRFSYYNIFDNQPSNLFNLLLEYTTISIEEREYVEIEGDISYISLEGGFYGIIAENGNYLPINKQNNLIGLENRRVNIRGYLKRDAVSIFMWGNIIFVENINIIKKKKIVCLHGGGETSSSLRNQSGMQSLISELGDNYEFIFLDGPENGNLWIRDPPGGKDNPTTDVNWAETSVNYINSQLIEDNYYALLGYSQGGAMSMVYLSNININKFNKIIFFSGYLPTTHNGLISKINENIPYNIPSLIYRGVSDFISIEMINELGTKFVNPQIINSNEGGHYLPLENHSDFSIVIDFIRN